MQVFKEYIRVQQKTVSCHISTASRAMQDYPQYHISIPKWLLTLNAINGTHSYFQWEKYDYKFVFEKSFSHDFIEARTPKFREQCAILVVDEESQDLLLNADQFFQGTICR